MLKKSVYDYQEEFPSFKVRKFLIEESRAKISKTWCGVFINVL